MTTFEYPVANRQDYLREAWYAGQSFYRANQTSEMAPDFYFHDVLPDMISQVAYPFSFEKEFAAFKVVGETREVWYLGPITVSIYLVAMVLGKRWMRDRKPFGLKSLLAYWNLLLAAFSFMGFLRTAPHLLYSWYAYGIVYTCCRAPSWSYGRGPTGFWVMVFVYSKIAELGDTVFLVLRKRNVSFLHWYHHCTVLLYSFNAYMYEQPSGQWFVVMNFGVHMIMYFYYFLAAVCAKPPSWGQIVTVMQILQMVIAVVVTISHTYAYHHVPLCDAAPRNLRWAFGMYASYAVLFLQFYFSRYVFNNKHKQNGIKEKHNGIKNEPADEKKEHNAIKNESVGEKKEQ